MTDVQVIGIGNVFLGDDAFGVEVAQRLAATRPDLAVSELGTRAFDLACAVADGPATIIVDAMQRGGAPGTLYVLEPEVDPQESVALEAHAIDPVRALRLALSLGERRARVIVVGCEPLTVEPSPVGRIGLSAPVAEAVPGALALVETLVARLRSEASTGSAAHA